MKLRNNFSTHYAGIIQVVVIMAATTSIILGLLMAVQFNIYQSYLQEIPELEQKLMAFEDNRNGLRAIEDNLPSSKELLKLKEQVGRYNNLLNFHGNSIDNLLERLENLLPNQVFLSSMVHYRITGEVKLVAESNQVEALTEFLKQLENAGYFGEVLLSRQSTDDDRSDYGFKYEISLFDKAVNS